MPIRTRGRSTKQQWTTLPARRVEPALKEKYKGHARHRHERAGYQQVTGGSLARVLGSTYSSCDIYWCPWVGADIEHLSGSEYRQDQELGIDWVPVLKETSLVCHSAPIQEGLRT